MFFLYVKCRNWRDSQWDFPAVLSQGLAAHTASSPQSSFHSDQLQPLVLCNLFPFPLPSPRSWHLPYLWYPSSDPSIPGLTVSPPETGQMDRSVRRCRKGTWGYLRVQVIEGLLSRNVSGSSPSHPELEASGGWAGEFLRISCLVDMGERWELWK